MSKRPTKSDLQCFWDFADKDGNGELSEQEFRAAVVEFSKRGGAPPPGPATIKDMFNNLDDSGNGCLSKAEYLRHVDAKARTEENFRQAFDTLDKDGDGTLSRAELTKVMKQQGYRDKQIDEVMNDCDKDKDGKISFDEFVSILPSKQ